MFGAELHLAEPFAGGGTGVLQALPGRFQYLRAVDGHFAQHAPGGEAKHAGVPQEISGGKVLPGLVQRGLFDETQYLMVIRFDITVSGLR